MNCYQCLSGVYTPIKEDYRTAMKDGRILVVPDVEVLTCTSCGDECIDAINHKKIDDARLKFKQKKK